MCGITKQLKPKIATKDLVVYKVLMRNYESPYQYFKYEPVTAIDNNRSLSKLYKTKIKDSRDYMFADYNDRKEFENDFPSYGVYELDKQVELGTVRCLGQGFHSYKQRCKEHLVNNDDIIVECIIPSGSEYYECYGGILVSNQIIVTKTL